MNRYPAAPMTRRAFGRTLGMAAAAGAFAERTSAAATQTGSGRPAAGGLDELCDLSAIELVARMRRRDVSAREVMTAHLARIERVNPRVNAIVTLVAERALADAARADELATRGGPLGVLHGLPVAHKDLVETAGIRTTRGSLFYRDNVPTRDAPIVTRMRAAGAITCGKTNTPELGAGSQTFNSVFGATRNPYDVTQDLRWQQRRRGRRAGLRDGADRGRQRHRRFAAQSGGVLQRGRAAPIAGPGAGRLEQLVAALGLRADGAIRRGCRALPERDRRPRFDEPAVDRRGWRPFRAPLEP